jgi:predicted esterase
MFSMSITLPEQHTFQAHLECRYLLQIPENAGGNPLLVIALHGYSSNPVVMLRLTAGLVGERHIVASIQAPNQHFLADGLPNAQSVAGYNWGIPAHWESSVRLHHEMLRTTLKSLRDRFQVDPERCLLVGFSQPVGLNYRFVATHPDEVGGVIGICGGVPRDWQDEKYQAVRAALLHISRDEDPIYPLAVAGTFAEKLRHRAKDVEFHLMPGGHRFPSKARGIVEPWLARVFGFR